MFDNKSLVLSLGILFEAVSFMMPCCIFLLMNMLLEWLMKNVKPAFSYFESNQKTYMVMNLNLLDFHLKRFFCFSYLHKRCNFLLLSITVQNTEQCSKITKVTAICVVMSPRKSTFLLFIINLEQKSEEICV